MKSRKKSDDKKGDWEMYIAFFLWIAGREQMFFFPRSYVWFNIVGLFLMHDHKMKPTVLGVAREGGGPLTP